MKECPKCGSADISVLYEPVNKSTKFDRPIDGVKKFMKNDTYYTTDKVKEEHLIYECYKCGYKKADYCLDNSNKNTEAEL